MYLRVDVSDVVVNEVYFFVVANLNSYPGKVLKNSDGTLPQTLGYKARNASHTQPNLAARMGSKNRAWAHSATRNGALCSTILPTVRLASSMTFPPDLPYLIASKPIFVVPYALFQLNKLKAVMLCRNKNAKCSSNQPTVTPMTGLYLLFSSERSFVFLASFLFEKKRRGTQSAE